MDLVLYEPRPSCSVLGDPELLKAGPRISAPDVIGWLLAVRAWAEVGSSSAQSRTSRR